jgi:4-amino-4-deoxy-L-arabinose transferase-like glycosyltransferase
MFMDGLIYSTVSKNLSNGIGDFWNPHFTNYLAPIFHGHPPLGFSIQSISFRIFGDDFIVDKLFSLSTFLITAFILLKIWKQLGLKHAWILLFFWILIPIVQWSTTNNVLENILTIFTSLSVLFYLKSQENKRFIFLTLTGLMLALGLLTKGPVALFPWSFPIILWFCIRRETIRYSIIDTCYLILSTLLPIALLILFSNAAKEGLLGYFNEQIVNSLKNIATVDSRFWILQKLLKQITLPLILLLIIYFRGSRMKFDSSLNFPKRRMQLAFILLAFSGILPIMISMKQSGFYMLGTFPFFAIAFSLIVYPYVDAYVKRIDFSSKRFLVFQVFSFGIFISGIGLGLMFKNTIPREKEKIQDCHLILTHLNEGENINILHTMSQDWSLYAFFARLKNVNLDPALENLHEYLLVDTKLYNDTILKKHKLIPLNTTQFSLYKRR